MSEQTYTETKKITIRWSSRDLRATLVISLNIILCGELWIFIKDWNFSLMILTVSCLAGSLGSKHRTHAKLPHSQSKALKQRLWLHPIVMLGFDPSKNLKTFSNFFSCPVFNYSSSFRNSSLFENKLTSLSTRYLL